MFLVRLLLASTVMIVCFATFASGALKLPDDEVQTLRAIFNTLGKKNWDFSNPCNSTVPPSMANEIAAVSCSNCTVNGNESYHVVGIILKGLNLPGTLPPDLVKLPCLQVLDLASNYLNGSIPSAWGSIPQLETISLLGNRLTGPIPGALSYIKTLKNFTVEFNRLSGNLPPELGNLPSIERLCLSSNYFTGELPTSFANLTSLKYFQINDNLFSGQIPNYIQNWKNLTTLYIQASGLRGPIPPLDLLKDLSELKISDLNIGPNGTFPVSIINVSQWDTLILRNCNLTGPLPDLILDNRITEFRTLDLSFNRLSGEIPSSFILLNSVDHIYLTGNLLTGPIPAWILDSRKAIDLSFNNFTIEKSKLSSSSCQKGDRRINLFKSSSVGNEIILSCSETSLPRCSQNRSSLHINCGGEEVYVDESTVFDNDTDPGGPSKFFLSQDKYWSFSSTGQVTSLEKAYILSNSSELSTDTTNPKLYMTARSSPLSLTYSAYCLVSGNYRVRLHFAEIVFTDDETYSSLGRRIFDVYIQKKQVLKDFDIVKAAGGVRKPNIQSFKTVVTDSTLEIRFYWARKGTTDIPLEGDYGPLISAISVDANLPIFVGCNSYCSDLGFFCILR